MITSGEPTPEFSLVTMLLDKQQSLTAVERFAQADLSCESRVEAQYRDLIPPHAPGDGEQYAFEVDLDSCSGCKACVAACHSLNGLEEEETWRGVGLLSGGSSREPVLQHVTTACHHCLDPACLEGCPVAAYDKDPLTGIVRHLDDQCIGCQYCIFKCPYDVPTYSRSKGIVRKCDMCQDRLAANEAPACVQSCPGQAIRISVVNKEQVIEESEVNHFLPGAPDPDYTLPTTAYKSKRPFPRNMLPADYHSARPQHAHLPLVFMLVLTQMSVGAFVVEQLLSLSGWGASESTASRMIHLVAALGLGLLGMGAAVFHLGRPLYAFRCWIGLRTSWLSREIVAFGLFAALATIYVLTAFNATRSNSGYSTQQLLGHASAAAGLAGLICSIMIYVDTRRPFWSGPLTTAKFFGTAAILGIPTGLLISIGASWWSEGAAFPLESIAVLCRWLMVATAGKLIVEFAVFQHLRDRHQTPLKRTARLMCGELALTTLRRLFFGVIGGLMLPAILMAEPILGTQFHPLFQFLIACLMLLALLIGELFERYLFFTAVVAPRMPGVQA